MSRMIIDEGWVAVRDADGKTGDGAGIHVQIPTAFFLNRSGTRFEAAAETGA